MKCKFYKSVERVKGTKSLFFASMDAVVFYSKTGIFFFAVQSLLDQSLVTLFTHLIQMDLPVLVPLSQLDKREDQLNGEIDKLNGRS